MQLAARFDGEIINADAMQMYRGLPIITNKISQDEQRSIPHHLLGNINLEEETWVVGVFKREANKIISEIRSRGRLPIVVGGTHYYTNSLLFKDTLVEAENEPAHELPDNSAFKDNFSQFPILTDTTEVMWKKLKEVDPIMAERWHPKDRRKIHRSLEIFLTTGRRASDIYAEQQHRKATRADSEDDAGSRPEPLLLWVHTQDKPLKERLDARVDKMLDAGLMDEVAEMNQYLQSRLEAGENLDTTKGIWQSIGFKEFQPYLSALKDGVDEEELQRLKLSGLESMKTATRRYAKYQTKWITKKMIPLLQEEGKLDRLYLLDSTDVARYAELVTDEAARLTQSFLAGSDMPAPSSISDTARDVLREAEVRASAQDTLCRKYCRNCDATLLTEEAWQKHVRGKSHRRNTRHAQRTALVPLGDAQQRALVPVASPKASDTDADVEAPISVSTT